VNFSVGIWSMTVKNYYCCL